MAVDFPQVCGIDRVFSPRLNLDLYNWGSSKREKITIGSEYIQEGGDSEISGSQKGQTK